MKKHSTALWKWTLLLVSGFILFLFLSQISPAIGSLSNNLPVKSTLLFAGGLCILGLYVILVKLFEKRHVSELNVSRALPDLLTGFAIGAVFIAGVIFILALIGCYKIDSIEIEWGAMLLDFSVLFLVAVNEEIIFRGIVFRMIKEQFNINAAFIISSLSFGLMHLWNVDMWTAIAISAEAGFMLAAAYNLRNNLWIPIGIHWAWNFMSSTVFGLVVSGTSIKEYSLIVPEISGPYILNGGSNGFEGSIVTCICGILIGFVLLYYSRKSHSTGKC